MEYPQMRGAFEWDNGNIYKNWFKHKVKQIECEEIFTNQPLLITPDLKHSKAEERHVALGKTKAGRLLYIVFTIRRNESIRVISARNMDKREKNIYVEEETKINS